MERTKNPDDRRQLASGFAKVAERMSPPAAAATLMSQMTGTDDPDVVGYLARGLGPVLGRLESNQAQELSERAAGLVSKAFAENPKSYVLPYLAEGLADLAGYLEPEMARALCTRAAIGLPISAKGRSLSNSAAALVYLAPRMERDKASTVCGKMVASLELTLQNYSPQIEDTLAFEISTLAQSFAALTAWLNPEDLTASRESACRELLQGVATIPNLIEGHTRDLAKPLFHKLAACTLGVKAGDLERMNRSIIDAQLGAVLHLSKLQPRPLPSQSLVDLLLKFILTVEKKGWTLEGLYSALYHGFHAIARVMSGKDPAEAETAMRKIIDAKDFKIEGWSWDELDGWLKTTKLDSDRKAAIEKIIEELKGKDRNSVPMDK